MQAVPRMPFNGRVAAVGLLLATTVATLIILALGQGVGHASTCDVATNTWIGGTGTWDTPAKWSAGHVPTSGEYVCINATGGATVTASGTDVAGSLEALTPLVISGSLTLSDVSQPSALATATLTGTLGGASPVTVTGSMSWTSGAIMKDAGTTVVAAGAELNITTTSGQVQLQAGRTLTNDGTVHWSGSATNGLAGYLGAVFNNAGSLLIDSDVQASNYAATAPLLVNTGTITKTAGTGTASIGWAVQNTGTLSATTGSILLQGGDRGFASTGSFERVNFGAGAYTLNTGATLSGAITVSGATVTTNATNARTVDSLSISAGSWIDNGTLSVGTLTLSTGGALGGTGTVTLTGAGTWSGGSMSGSGTTRIAGSAVLTIPSTSATTVLVQAGRTLDNTGTVHWTGDGHFGGYAGALLNNSGTLLLDGDAVMNNYASSGTPPVLVNTGTLSKTGGTGAAQLGWPLQNHGSLSVSSGSVMIIGGDGGTASTGSFSGPLELRGANFTLAPGAALSGAITVSSGTLTHTGQANDPTLPSLTITSVGGVPTPGTFVEEGALTVDSLTLRSALAGAGTVTLTGPSTWSAGAMNGTGTTVVAPGANLTVNPGCACALGLSAGRTLINTGTVEMSTVGGIGMYPASGPDAAAEFDNAGTLLMSGRGYFYLMAGSGTAPQLVNTGLVHDTVTGADHPAIGVGIVNNGTITADSGQIMLTRGSGLSPSSGEFHNVDFRGGNFTLGQGSTLSGTINVTTGSVTHTGSATDPALSVLNLPYVVGVTAGTFAENGTLSVNTLTIAAGVLDGTGTLTITGTGTWSGGGGMQGSGTTSVAPGVTLTIPIAQGGGLAVGTSRTLANDGTIEMTSSGSLLFYPGSRLDNAGLLLFDADATLTALSGSPAPFLSNIGTIHKTGGGLTSWSLPVVNNGNMIAESPARIQLTGGDANSTGTTGTFRNVQFNGGTFTLAQGAQLEGSMEVSKTNNYSSQVLVTGDVPVTTGSTLLFSGGEIGGAGTLRIDGSMDWRGSLMTGIGRTMVAPGGTLTLNGPSTVGLGAGRRLENAGVMSWPGTGWLTMGAGASLINSGRFDLVGDHVIQDLSAGGARPVLRNTGLLIKPAGTGVTTVGVDLDNLGTVEVDAGTVTLTGALRGYTPSSKQLVGGAFVLDNAVFQSPGLAVGTLMSAITLDGAGAALRNSSTAGNALGALARLTGAGSLTLRDGASLSTSVALNSAGTVTVGPASNLTLGGTFTQTGGGTTLTDATSQLTAGESGLLLQAGSLAGVGTLAGPVSNTGATIRPGGAGTIGTLSVTGSFAQSGTGRLLLDVAADGSHDQLTATAAATLGGSLTLVPATGTYAVGTSFPLAAFTARTGGFATVDGQDLGDGNVLWLADGGTSLTATVTDGSVAQFGTVQINAGAAVTGTPDVTLTLTAPGGIGQVRLATDTLPTGAFDAITSPQSWALPDLDGAHSVYAQFHDTLGNQSYPTSATIVLDSTAPFATIAPPTSPTAAGTVTFSEDVLGVAASNVVLRVTGTSTSLAVTLTCRDDAGTVVVCASGAVRSVTVQPDAPLLPTVSYTLSVNPTGAAPLIADPAGNATPTVSREFTLCSSPLTAC